MKEIFSARNTLVTLAVTVMCVAALVWWLVVSGRPEVPSAKLAAEADRPSSEKSPSTAINEATEALKQLGNQLAPSARSRTDQAPKFDVAHIEPNGDAVIAGRAAPGASVELLRNGEVHDRTAADSSGAFVFVPKPLPPGNYDLTLRAREPGGKETASEKSVAVTLSPGKSAQSVAVLGPKTPADVLPKPTTKSEAAVRIETVEVGDGGGLHVFGRSAPGSTIRLYLNDAYIATGTTAPDGRIGFTIRSGVKSGQYQIRLDQVSASERVLSRAEVPYSVVATLAVPSSSAPRVVATRRPAPSPALADERGGRGSDPAVDSPVNAQTSLQSTASTSSTPRPDAARAATEQSGPQTASRESTSAPTRLPGPQLPANNVAGPSRTEPEIPHTSTASADRPNTTVVPSIDTKAVVKGDNLWRISEITYGHGTRYILIYGANRNQIRDPDLIYPGQIFVLPKALPQQ